MNYEVFPLKIDNLSTITVNGADSYLDFASRKIFLSMNSRFRMRPKTSFAAEVRPRYKAAVRKEGTYKAAATSHDHDHFIVDNVAASVSASVRIITRDDQSTLEANSNTW